MAKKLYGSWATTPDVKGLMRWTSADGKTAIDVNCAAACGISAEDWSKLTPGTQWLVGYGTKQKLADGLAAGADSVSQYIGMLQDRVAEFEGGGFMSGGMPWAVEAIARIKSVPIEQVRKTWLAATQEQREKWYGSEAVKAAVVLIENEKKTARAAAVLKSAGVVDELAEFSGKDKK